MGWWGELDRAVERQTVGSGRAKYPYRREEDKIAWKVSNNILFYEVIVVFFITITLAISLATWSVLRYDNIVIEFFEGINQTINNIPVYEVLDVPVNTKGQFVVDAIEEDGGYCPGETLLYEYQWTSNRNAVNAIYQSYHVIHKDGVRKIWWSEGRRAYTIVSEVGVVGVKARNQFTSGDVIPENFPVFGQSVQTYMLITAQSNAGRATQVRVNFRLRENCEQN